MTVFAAKCDKSVKTGEGLVAFFEYCRGSGDLDTSCGNGIINAVTSVYFKIFNFCDVEKCKIEECSCGCLDNLHKGDDGLGTIPEKHNKPLIDTYKWFGLEAKLIDRLDGRLTEFCSGNFIRVANGQYTYVQKLRKMITSCSTVLNPDVIKNGWTAHYLRSLGDMYSILYEGVPVYSDFAKMLQTAHDKLKLNFTLVEGVSYGASEAFKVRNTHKVDVCPESIIDISIVNDMSIAELEALKMVFQQSKISLPPHQQRRCNLRARTQKWVDLADDISGWVDRLSLGKFQKQVRKKLVLATKDPMAALQRAAHEGNC
jgi:hypothetical protein